MDVRGGCRERRGGAGFRARAGVLRGRLAGRRAGRAGVVPPARRRPRDPAPSDRRRVSAASLPERASVSWRAPMTPARLRTYARSWTVTTIFQVLPMTATGVLLLFI